MTTSARQGGLRQLLGNFASLLTARLPLRHLARLSVHRRRMLGVAQYGVLNLVHGYITLVGALSPFPVGTAWWHYGADALHGDDSERFLRLASFMSKVELAFGLAAILIAMALVPWVSKWLHWPPEARTLPISTASPCWRRCGRRPTAYCSWPTGSTDWRASSGHAYMPADGRVDRLDCRMGAAGFPLDWLLSAIAEGGSMWIFGLRELARMKRARGWSSSRRRSPLTSRIRGCCGSSPPPMPT